MDYGLLMSNVERAMGGRKLTQQDLLYESLRRAILDGDIRHGSRLLATRALAEQLGIARNSVLFAYERLTDDGGADAFVHISAVERAGLTDLAENQRCTFELELDRRGKRQCADAGKPFIAPRRGSAARAHEPGRSHAVSSRRARAR